MPTIEELRKWSAEKVMGWHVSDYTPDYYRDFKYPTLLISSWLPDDPTTGQIWMVVERMRELGWVCYLLDMEKYWQAQIFHKGKKENEWKKLGHDSNPCIAILNAFYAALEGNWREYEQF